MTRVNFLVSLARIYTVSILVVLLYPRKRLLLRVETFHNFNYPGQSLVINHSSIFSRIINLSGPWERAGNVIIFFLLYLAINLQFRSLGPGLTLVVVCSTSCLVEMIQFLIPGRVSSLTDFALNSFGAVLAFYTCRFRSKNT